MATVYEEIDTLKTRVDAVESILSGIDLTDTGWNTLPLADGIQAYGGAPQYRRIGKIVSIRGAVKNVLAADKWFPIHCTFMID